MITHIEGETAAELFEEGLNMFRVGGVLESSRAGQVVTIHSPVFMTLRNPACRVLDDPIRNANPFFHMMEFVWMMAGRRDVDWLCQFNQRMVEFSNDGVLNAAYGYRWRKRWSVDQIIAVISKLRTHPNTRQAVLMMWDPEMDNVNGLNDYACNVTILLRQVKGALNMLVCNRSNDFIWGTLGANICHMTMLHEYIAWASGIPLGEYSVISMNMHMYTGMPNYDALSKMLRCDEIYRDVDPENMFLSQDYNTDFLGECDRFCAGEGLPMNSWLAGTALPAREAWFAHKQGKKDKALKWAGSIKQKDWSIACQNWLHRKYATSLSAT